MASDCVMRWRIIIEAYSPNLLYIPGPENIITHALSRLPIINSHEDQEENQLCARYAQVCKKLFVQNQHITEKSPLDIDLIVEHQKKE